METRSSLWIDRGLLIVRVALGVVFIMHGWQKLTVFGFAGVSGFMATLGIPYPTISGVVVTLVELVGGLALLTGAFTRTAAFIITGNMAVAILTAHLAGGFFLPAGYEYALTLMLVSGAVTMMGAGKYSIDAWRARPSETPASRLKLAA